MTMNKGHACGVIQSNNNAAYTELRAHTGSRATSRARGQSSAQQREFGAKELLNLSESNKRAFSSRKQHMAVITLSQFVAGKKMIVVRCFSVPPSCIPIKYNIVGNT